MDLSLNSFLNTLLIILILASANTPYVAAERQKRPNYCRKSCTKDEDCKQLYKRCLKDGVCGLSCVNPSIVCPPLKSPRYGFVRNTSNVFDSNVEYGCYKGYHLVGISQRRCRADRNWTGEDPDCIPIAKCNALLAVEHATHNGTLHQRQYELGTEIYYQCMDGYFPDDDLGSIRIAKCVLDSSNVAQWVGPNLRCRAKACEDPKVPNSEWIGESLEHPSEISFTCKTGFKQFHHGWQVPDESVRLRCEKDGTWNDVFPSCQPINCTYPESPINGEVKGNAVTFKSKITYSCKGGYRLVGQRQRVCKADGTWNGNEPSCEEIICPPLPPFYNGDVENAGNKAGTTVHFRCWESMTMSGPEYATCQNDGKWSNFPPQCFGSCRVPRILNGTVKEYSPNYMVQHETPVTLVCSAGHEAEGINRLICNNGTWSDPPICIPAACDWPPEVENAMAIFIKSRHGQYARYECNAGFRPKNDNKRICRYGKWSWVDEKTPFKCLQVYCKNPRKIYGQLRGGQIMLEGQVGSYTFPSNNETEHGRSLTFQCNKGNILIGPPRATCINGTWQPKFIPECVPQRHPTKDGIRWVRDKRSSYCEQVRSDWRRKIIYSWRRGIFTAKVVCSKGLHFSNGFTNRYVYCIDGQWSRQFPECTSRKNSHLVTGKCRIPSKKKGSYTLAKNGKPLHSGEYVSSGSKVNLLCESDGYDVSYEVLECHHGKLMGRNGRCRSTRQATKFCERPNIKRQFIAYRTASTSEGDSKIYLSAQQSVFKNGTVIQYKCDSDSVDTEWSSIICLNGEWNFFTEQCGNH